MANTGILAGLDSMDENFASVTLEGDFAEESKLLMLALEAESTPEEFDALINDAAVEMALYGLIESADIATEATKTIVKMSKAGKFSSVQSRAAIRLAKKANDPAYTKYAKGRETMLKNREIIYKKYGAKAKSEAKKVLQNARRKAGAMNSNAGKTIVDKIDKQIDKAAK